MYTIDVKHNKESAVNMSSYYREVYQMKKSRIICSILLLAMMMSVSAGASAKNYYNTKYNDFNDARKAAIADRKEEEIARLSIEEEENTDKVTADFNGDGKKEFVKLSRKWNSTYSKSTISVTMNGKKIIKTVIGNNLSTMYTQFYTVKFGEMVLGVLQFGDNDYAYGGVYVYTWNQSGLKKIKEYVTDGYLSTLVSDDLDSGKEVFYLVDSKQMYDSKKWPKHVMKKYAKWKNDEGTSVTETQYIKYELKNGRLRKVGKDSYFRVGMCYD